jgi:hypothetical protein
MTDSLPTAGRHSGYKFAWADDPHRTRVLNMKKALKTAAAIPVLLLGTTVWTGQSFADAQLFEWIGEWNMNLDGRVGTLEIVDSKRDCVSPPWCSLVLRFTDSGGTSYSGSITNVFDRWQHMVFMLSLPGGIRQVFNAYLFSWDKNKLAGTTISPTSGNRTFGFYALRK